MPPTTLIDDRKPAHDKSDVRQSRITDHSTPLDFTEMYERYYGYVVRLIASKGIHHADAEDVAQKILTRFYERDSLNFYKPDHVTLHGGVEYTTKFTTFLSGFVVTYLQHHLSRQTIVDNRLILGYGDEGLELEETPYDQDFTGPEYVEALTEIHRRLSGAEVQSTIVLADLFEAMREQISYTGKYATSKLAEQFGVSPAHIRTYIALIRTQLEGL